MGVRSLKDQRAVGRQKEKKAAMFLSKKGYRILEHSYRTPCGEIDLIAEHEGRIIFVEVKYRRSLRFGQPQRLWTGASSADHEDGVLLCERAASGRPSSAV